MEIPLPASRGRRLGEGLHRFGRLARCHEMGHARDGAAQAGRHEQRARHARAPPRHQGREGARAPKTARPALQRRRGRPRAPTAESLPQLRVPVKHAQRGARSGNGGDERAALLRRRAPCREQAPETALPSLVGKGAPLARALRHEGEPASAPVSARCQGRGQGGEAAAGA